MKRRVLLSWAILLASLALFVYELASKKSFSKFQLFDLQFLEGALILLLLVTCWSNYLKSIKKMFVHFFSAMVMFLFLTTVKWEFDSTFLSVAHAMCYIYLVLILTIITRKSEPVRSISA